MRDLTFAAFGMLCVASAALAAPPFEAVDENMDDSISRTEFADANVDIGPFGVLDLDDNGMLDEREYRAIGFNGRFADWDADHDALLSRDEFYTGAFEHFDADRSGYWDQLEWDRAGEEGFSWDSV